MKSYDTVSQATTDLNNQGYKHQFDLKEDCIVDVDNDKSYGPSDFEIEGFWRFEGMTNPADNMILYKINANGEKGTLLESYGNDAVSLDDKMRERFDLKK